MRQVVVTEAAEADLDGIADYISESSVSNAIAVDARVRAEIRALGSFPEIGRIGRAAGTRELIVPHDQCAIVYELNNEFVRVLRVMHGRQFWPKPDSDED